MAHISTLRQKFPIPEGPPGQAGRTLADTGLSCSLARTHDWYDFTAMEAIVRTQRHSLRNICLGALKGGTCFPSLSDFPISRSSGYRRTISRHRGKKQQRGSQTSDYGYCQLITISSARTQSLSITSE
jgi:hypothetical protein